MEKEINPLEAFNGLERRLPENCVEYMLFIIDTKLNSRKTLSALETVRKEALKLANSLTKDYIWQRDPFNLDLKRDKDLAYLHGTTNYSDSVEDEWLIVYILRQLSKTRPSLWIRIFDTDGEFLLVEAANVLPQWLDPDMDCGRVWIHDFKLKIIPPPSLNNKTIDKSTVPPQPLTTAEAVDVLKRKSEILIHSTFIEAESFYRLEKYPSHIAKSLHHSCVTIPRKLAHVLHVVPRSVAPAVEAFYLRDPVEMKPIMSATTLNPSSTTTTKTAATTTVTASIPCAIMAQAAVLKKGTTTKPIGRSLCFPPTDLVTLSAPFTRTLFAQLKSSPFPPPLPPIWSRILAPAQRAAESSSATAQEKLVYGRLEMGMKLSVGFELLLGSSRQKDNRAVREVGVMLEDLEEDGGEGLPTDAEMNGWKGAGRDDDESWMDINFEDFDRELGGRQGTAASPFAPGGAPAGAATTGATSSARQGVATGATAGSNGDGADTGFGDPTTQTSIRKMVQRFEAFLNDETAGLDGAIHHDPNSHPDDSDSSWDSDLDTSDDEDEEPGEDDDEGEDTAVSFDEAEFARMMREMMGMPSSDPTSTTNVRLSHNESGYNSVKGKGKARAVEEGAEVAEEAKEIQNLMQQMESELNSHGALALDLTPGKLKTLRTKPSPYPPENNIPQSEGKGKGGGKEVALPTHQEEQGDDDEEESDEDGEVDIDYNLAANLLESFKSQGGTAGPAGNILGMMGMRLPRDEDEEDGEVGKRGSGTKTS